MASRFLGRDYSTLREEIIQFLRTRLPQDWDYTNLADPVVIYAETLARIGDQLHYTIDEIRRECDISTAQRASSIYSYALREGYNLMLPNSSFGTLTITANKDFETGGKVQLQINKFDEIKVKSTGDVLYAAKSIDSILQEPLDNEYVETIRNYINESNFDDQNTHDDLENNRDIYSRYANTIYNRSVHLPVVLGKKADFQFTYNDINQDSTVTLPDAMIDRRLFRLIHHIASENTDEELRYVIDVISTGYSEKSYSLTPKFIGNSLVLNIEFPTDYSVLFKPSDTFTFEYIQVMNNVIEPTDENTESIDLSNYITKAVAVDDIDIKTSYKVDLGNGIKGYRDYEDPVVTREQYKKYLHDYSALLTKDNYSTYIKSAYSSYCTVFDHGDNYKDILPYGTQLMPRVIYISTDDNFSARKQMWEDLKERSSRSDCIVMVPYGKDPYTIVVKADCYLLGVSASEVATKIQSELINYYGSTIGERKPEISVINYLVHKASDHVIRMESCLVRDTTFGTIDTTFANTATLTNDEIDHLYAALEDGDNNLNYSYTVDRVDSDGNKYSDTVYPLRDEFTGTNGTVYYYNKYPKFDYDEKYRNESKSDNYNYPKIYHLISYNNDDPDSSNEDPITSYDTLVQYQDNYGELDRKEFDLKDENLFKINSDYINNKHNYQYCYWLNNGQIESGLVENDSIKDHYIGVPPHLTHEFYISSNSKIYENDLVTIKLVATKDIPIQSISGYRLHCTYSYEVQTREDASDKFETDYSKPENYGTKTGYINYASYDESTGQFKTDAIDKNLYKDEFLFNNDGSAANDTIYKYDELASTPIDDNTRIVITLSNVTDGILTPKCYIKPYYIKHHFMIPVLNNVVVLVKAISK